MTQGQRKGKLAVCVMPAVLQEVPLERARENGHVYLILPFKTRSSGIVRRWRGNTGRGGL